MIPSGKISKAAGVLHGQGLKQPTAAPLQGFAPQQGIPQGVGPVAPEPTRGILVMTQDKYLKQPSKVLQGKIYSQEPLIPQGQTLEPVAGPRLNLESGAAATPIPVLMGSVGKGPKASVSGPAGVVQSSEILPQGKY